MAGERVSICTAPVVEQSAVIVTDCHDFEVKQLTDPFC